MNRSIAISQRQAEILLKAAEKQKAIVELQMGITRVRLIPRSLVPPETAPVDDGTTPESFKSFADYERWRDGHAGND